ncbi:hypothetical protein FPSE5266_03430 [Fusarium pseudograminearum]|nr:hypothetical protein FPSE5266_03430 [Fusarium pseudograminearum]
MKYWLLLFFALVATHAAADDLSDFSNDLATDVGPLLVLFGESMTRQYLSESTSFLDYLIFAMAPIGILTAITSVIRVCGHSTLRAFIGRSQEGDGVVEAELCTSTSRDVCELFNKGGITRVLGRPQILELIHIKNPGREDELHLFRHLLERTKCSMTEEWIKDERYIPVIGYVSDHSSSKHTQFAPMPNLSLNVGIKRRPRWVFVAIALLGFILQGGVLTLAGVGVWMLGWNLSDSGSSASKNYAPIMFITGTIVMCGGMFSCAALIGQTTREVRYSREPGTPRSRLLWLQPGPQVIGDQSFDAFAHFENIEEEPLPVWTSSRKDFNERFELYTFFAVTAVLLGYISQFIGLRGMKAWVSLAQLGITIIMSILRGLLRVQRLGRDANKLGKMPDMIAGHELDWIAFELALGNSIGDTSFCFTGNYNKLDPPYSISIPESAATNLHENQIDFEKVLQIRKRLSYLTGHDPTRANNKEVQQWERSQIKAREPAQRLAAAICKVAEKLIRKKTIKGKITIQVEIRASASNGDKHEEQMIDVVLTPPSGSQTKWYVDSSRLEAILGLSMWSLVSAKDLHDVDQTGNTISLFENVQWRRLVYYTLADEQHFADPSTYAEPWSDVSIWFGPDAGRLYHDRIRIETNSINVPTRFLMNPRIPFWYQICGWNTVYDSLQSKLVLDPANSYTDATTLMVALAPTEDSRLQICAQDLFLAIISPLLDILVTGETEILESDGHVLLQNSTVTAVSDILVESNLATRFEALSCAVSLLSARIQPDQDTFLSDLTETANTYRRSAEWERGETLMRWACSKLLKPGYKVAVELFYQYGQGILEEELINYDAILSSTDSLNRFLRVLQATGEFYRWSCAQRSNKGRLEFGLEGIEWMVTTFDELSTRSPEVREILNNYEHVANLMKSSDSSDWLPQNLPESVGTANQHPLVEAIRDDDRKMTLWHLCFTATGDFDRHQLHPALPLAARNGWSEVVNAILEMNGDLDCKDVDGRTAISYCAEHGHLSLLQHFVSLGASINSEDNDGRTPILYAVK